ncbi:glycosyltransferase [Bacteroides sp.]|uniref:glycosyltransferase n=1 Tax=Bacteroides sp. TaxID=29523 RepID=UPI002607CCDB|nr:glycosyltransferase [Bacteroides sp.]MDD3040472.1 glycosyltransferase [Bacteroides sp.]
MYKKIYIADILSHTYQGKSTGHYFAVARNYQEMFSDRVVVAGGPVYKTGFIGDNLLPLPYNSGGGGIKGRLKTFSNARKLFKEAEGQVIVLQQCTTITTFLCIAFFYHRKSRLFMIQYNREGFRSKLGNLLFKLAKRKLDGIICPNDMVGEAFQGVPYCVVPDYIYTGDASQQGKPYSDRKYDFCIVGRLSPEKGAVEVAKYIARTVYKLVIAGKPQSEDLANELREACANATNIELHLGLIPDEDYYSYIHNSKYAFLNYSGEYSERSSGVVFDTLFNGVPVVGRRCKALQFIEDDGLGIVDDDIMALDIPLLMNKEYHSQLLENIQSYRKNQRKYIDILNHFIKP